MFCFVHSPMVVLSMMSDVHFMILSVQIFWRPWLQSLNSNYNVITKSYDKHKNDLIQKTNKLIITDSTALCIKTRIVKLKRSLDLS